jgi:hypothetical protein
MQVLVRRERDCGDLLRVLATLHVSDQFLFAEGKIGGLGRPGGSGGK